MSGSGQGGENQPGLNLAGLVLLTGLMIWATLELGPLVRDSEVQITPAITGFAAAVGTLKIGTASLHLIAHFLDWRASHTPSGAKGKSEWATHKQLKSELNTKHTGPYWGRMATGKKQVLFSDYVSNAMTIGPAGSKKTIAVVYPAIFSILHSKIVPCFKGELAPVCMAMLKARGENVLILNPYGLFKDILGESDQYSPLDIFVFALYTPGYLRDLPDDLREFSEQIFPEPQSEGENKIFRLGGHDCIAIVICIEVMLEGYGASLSSVALMIEDRQSLEDHLRWIVGIDVLGQPLPTGPMAIEKSEWAEHHDPEDLAEFARLIRSRARSLLKLMMTADSRTFDSFLKGAQQAMAPFAFGRLSTAMGRSTFSMSDLKGDTPTTLFIITDSSRPATSNVYSGLIQWCALTALKRHPNKSAPVYLLQDEATNTKIHELASLLTWGRTYGIRLHLIFQDLNAFEYVYGPEALQTLLSETEIKQFLPGQRSPKTLKLISEELLGNQSVMMPTLSSNGPGSGLHESMSEASRPLMTADEIRRTQHGILFIRQQQPVLFEPVSYAEVEPWRSQADINPFHGKPFKKKVKLRLRT